MPKINGIIGMEKLNKDLKKLGKVPQKHVTAATKKGMGIVLKAARANAPVDKGDLKKGIIMTGERSKLKGKKVYRIVFDRAMNAVFQKPAKGGGKGGYYPISQEYGYFAKNGRYIPGYRFVDEAFTPNVKQVENVIKSEMQKRIRDEVRKAGL